MNLFFKPGIQLMNKLRYPKKLLLIGAIFAISVLIFTYQLITQSMSIMDFSNKELYGVEYINPLYIVMANVQNYRHLNNNLVLGDQSAKDSINSVINEIDSAILVVDAKDNKLGSILRTTQDWNDIKAKWNSVKSQIAMDNTKPHFEEISDIIKKIENLIITACDTSNLTLDPDIDTYYSMDTYCTKAPSFSEEAALIRDIGNRILITKNLTPEDHEAIIINKTLMDQFNKKGILTNIQKVINERKSLAPTYLPLMESLTSETNNLVHIIDNSLISNTSNITNQSFTENANALINLSYRIEGQVSQNLYSMIQERVNKISNNLYTNLFISIVSLLLLIYLFVAVYLSIISSIRMLVQGSEQLANGDLTADVKLETKDELTQVASSFNIMRDTLSKIITELHTVVKAAMQGDLSKRINIEDKKGFSKDLSIGINQVSDVFQTVIKETAFVLDNLSKGILTMKIDKDYEGSFGELKNYVNRTTESLEKLISNIKIATETINRAAQEIALGNNDLAKRTEQQAAFLEETSTSIEELTATVKQNAENAKQANDLANSASTVAIRGGEAVEQVIDVMTTINDSSRKVVDIISVIDEIAFQTNILALNAAVEAARAGEQGRGFAVVAAEVRNLAQRTSSAAKEIKILISKSVENVSGGTKLVDNAGNTMKEIVSAVNRVTEIMAEIANASQEQSNGIEQVNQAILQMDQVTQQNTTLVEEAAAAAQSMELQTAQMNKMVRIFKLSTTQDSSDDSNIFMQKPFDTSKKISKRRDQDQPVENKRKVKSQDNDPSKHDEWNEF